MKDIISNNIEITNGKICSLIEQDTFIKFGLLLLPEPKQKLLKHKSNITL
jgi:hypothetical protein